MAEQESDPATEVTHLLGAIEEGDVRAAEELLPLVYEELRRLAAQRLAQEKPGQTLQATALVHEAYLRLVDDKRHDWNGRGHFFGAAAEAMRRILVDRARRKQRLKHGGGHQRVDLDASAIAVPTTREDLVALDDALRGLEAHDEAVAGVVKLRYFAGLTIPQVAVTLGVSERTADRRWAYGRAWLYDQMAGED